MSLYSITLWDALKFEVLNAQEEDLAQEALLALAEIATTLSAGSTGPLNAYLRPITKECNEHLEDAPTKQSQASGQILHTVASASPKVTNVVLSTVLPNLFTLYQTADTLAKRRGLLEVLVQLVRANIEVYGEWRSVSKLAGDQTANNALDKFSTQALEVMIGGLSTAPIKEVSFRLVCVNGLLQMTKVRQVLGDEDIAKVIQLFHVVIAEESFGKDEMKEAAINGLVEISHQKPQLVVDKAFPVFMAQLPDTDEDGSLPYVPVLEAFAKLGSEEKIFDTVMLRLKNKLNAAVKQQASSTYLVALLSAMLYALNQGAAKLEQDTGIPPYYQDIVLPLLSQVSSSATLHQKVFDDEITLDFVGRICNIIIRPQSVDLQSKISGELFSLFCGPSQTEIPSFNLESTPQQTRWMMVSAHLLAALRKDATLPCDTQYLLHSLVQFSQRPSLSPRVRAATLCQISLVVNKFIPTASLKPTLEPILNAPMELLNPSHLNPTTIRTTFAILKGLVLRNSTLLSKLYPALLSFLSISPYSAIVAHGFTTLLQPDDLLTKANHCTISGLHKQKTFNLLVPSIAASFRDADKDMKPNYLIALSGVLRWLPFEIVSEELGQLIPLLLQSLDLQGEDGVKEAAVGTLTSVLAQSPKAVEEHAGSLIARLLNTATVGGGGAAARSGAAATPARVRAVALKCLAMVPAQLRQEIVLPYRRQVVKKLTGALDDKKRGVRAEAVRCRARWLEIDEMWEDED